MLAANRLGGRWEHRLGLSRSFFPSAATTWSSPGRFLVFRVSVILKRSFQGRLEPCVGFARPFAWSLPCCLIFIDEDFFCFPVIRRPYNSESNQSGSRSLKFW